MTDEPTNPHYRLKVAAERAREAAEVSLDPLDHVVKNAMASVVETEIRDIERAVYIRTHGPMGDVSDLPSWGSITKPGQGFSTLP